MRYGTQVAARSSDTSALHLARLWLTARNCTEHTLDLTVTEYGEQIPPCPVIDPIESQVVLDTEDRPDAVAAGDLNGDGKPDIVVANTSSNSVSVFFGNGGGTTIGGGLDSGSTTIFSRSSGNHGKNRRLSIALSTR